MVKFLLLLIFYLYSCSTIDDVKLEKALQVSGNNYTELKKVLSHYSQNKDDSFKFKAAKFLISNMPEHYTYGGEYFESYAKKLDSLNPNMSNKTKIIMYNDFFNKNRGNNFLKKELDIENITAEFLIRNIDYKFELLEIVPWGKSISFSDFCEYILPYRFDIEPLLDIEPNSINTLSEISKSLKYVNATITNSAEYIMEELFKHNELPDYIQTPHGYSYLKLCTTIAANHLMKMRAICVPASIDFTLWANSNNTHNWINYVDAYDKNTNIDYIYRSKIAKVYRKTYSHNKTLKDDINFIPHLFTSFIKDVTNHYVNTKDIDIHYNRNIEGKVKNVYLSIFNNLDWEEIDWSIINKKGYAKFYNMGTGIVYLPTYYLQDKRVIAGYPFILEYNGGIKKLIPNVEDKIKLHLTRKYPKNIDKVKWDRNIVGAAIEASNNKDFKVADTITFIENDTDTSKYIINVNLHKKYQYFRLIHNEASKEIFLSELSFINNDNEEINGDFFTLDSTHNVVTHIAHIGNRLFSNNLSYVSVKNNIVIDFGKPVNISSIHITLRNDDNYIYPKNRYELLYSGAEGWVSLAVKEAESNFIEFDNVPSGALYWLKNLTAGKEERIFTYENGEMKFW